MIDVPDTQPRRRSGRPDKPIPRSELLRTARGLFAAGGYAGVSMADIAHKAGLQKSSLFHHFPTKDQLYKEVLDGVITEILGAVTAEMLEDTDYVTRLERSTVALVRVLGADTTRARIVMRELLNEDGERSHTDSIVKMMNASVEFLEEGAKAGAWPKQDFHQVILTMSGVHAFYFVVPRVTKQFAGFDPYSAEALDKRVDEIREQVRRMVGPKPRIHA